MCVQKIVPRGIRGARSSVFHGAIIKTSLHAPARIPTASKAFWVLISMQLRFAAMHASAVAAVGLLRW
jgi:hypothetical protein